MLSPDGRRCRESVCCFPKVGVEKWVGGAATRRRFKDANCNESWCREGVREGTQENQLAWRQHLFFFVGFLLLALSYEKLEETGKEE